MKETFRGGPEGQRRQEKEYTGRGERRTRPQKPRSDRGADRENPHPLAGQEREHPFAPEEGLVWGKNAVTELLKSGAAVDTVLLSDTLAPAAAGYYTALAKEAGAVVKRAPAGKLQKLCGTPEHQGVAARAAQIEYKTLDDLFAEAETRGEPPFFVLCDGVEDPHNLGAVLRTAYLCGAHGVVIPRRGGVGVTGTVMKSSAGAAARIPVARVANLAQAIREIKERNVFVYCADLVGQTLDHTDLSGAVALVLGSEGSGPSALTRKLCDAAVTLEMAPAPSATGVDSYNVSVAAGILLYDVMRKRRRA